MTLSRILQAKLFREGLLGLLFYLWREKGVYAMRVEEIISPELAAHIGQAKVIGIDIGSRSAKGVLIAHGQIYTALTATGLYMQQTAEKIFTKLLKQAGLEQDDISYIVGTGYGRIALEFEKIPHQIVTEISCHAMGAHYLNADVRTIIDIGGQDSKAIKVDPKTGKVTEFVMNDKCAAGTGRFLEKIANLLDLDVRDLGEKALQAQQPVLISSQCVVFAESEVISLRARGEKREDIAAGIHQSVARRIRNLLSRVGIEPGLVFTGGVANNIGMRKELEELLEIPISAVNLDTVFAGALGAAVYAQRYAGAGAYENQDDAASYHLDLTDFNNRIAKQEEFITQGAEGAKKVGYLCSYTPLELFNAAQVAHTRLFKAGTGSQVASGELITQSVFCDFTKSCLGAFREGDPLVNSLDKVYTFYTCDSMKKVAEAINEYFVPTGIFLLPRVRDRESSRNYFRTELINLKNDLEKLTGTSIPEEKVREQIALYNKIRILLKQISDLRKRPNPPLTGADFLDLVRGYYYLPAEELLGLYREIYERLAAVPEEGPKRIRLMMAGGIVADGDRRVLDIVEKEIGARIVVEDHCAGIKPVYHPIAEQEDPYKALADGYLDQAPCARMKTLEDRVKFSGQLAGEYNVDGVIYYYLKFCPCYGLTKNEFFRHFQELGVPILEIPSDYSQSDEGQLKTRIEAFIEVLGERSVQNDNTGASKSA